MQETIILTLNTRMASSSFLIKIIPLLADIFVFSYPFYLMYLYFFQERIAKQITHDKSQKIYALTIFFATASAIVLNYVVKFFVSEQRPYHTLDLTINPQESLVLQDIPTDSFPSDHAAVGMAVATTILILWYTSQNKKLITAGRIFLSFSLIMNFSRITMWLHRPFDIIWGMCVGFIAWYFLTTPGVRNPMTRYIYTPLIQFQEKIFSRIKL